MDSSVALIRALERLGYKQGDNLAFEHRGANFHPDRLPSLVSELAASHVDVIVNTSYLAALAAKQGTTIPIVSGFNGGDPVGTGLVSDLTRPGGNMTGISDLASELTPKRMELLKAIAPGLRRLAILWNEGDLGMTLRYRASEEGAKVMGIAVQPLGVRAPDDFEHAFAAMNREMPDAILMVSDALTFFNHKKVFEFAAAHRLPAMYEFAFYVRNGGLMSYSPDLDDMFGRIADLVDRILKGQKPGVLPFEMPSRFTFAINLKTAKEIGLTVPASLLASADEVIE